MTTQAAIPPEHLLYGPARPGRSRRSVEPEMETLAALELDVEVVDRVTFNAYCGDPDGDTLSALVELLFAAEDLPAAVSIEETRSRRLEPFSYRIELRLRIKSTRLLALEAQARRRAEHGNDGWRVTETTATLAEALVFSSGLPEPHQLGIRFGSCKTRLLT